MESKSVTMNSLDISSRRVRRGARARKNRQTSKELVSLIQETNSKVKTQVFRNASFPSNIPPLMSLSLNNPMSVSSPKKVIDKVTLKIEFKIQVATNHYGMFIRKRNQKCSYIRIHSFVQGDKPYFFLTSSSVLNHQTDVDQHLSLPLENLNLSAPSTTENISMVNYYPDRSSLYDPSSSSAKAFEETRRERSKKKQKKKKKLTKDNKYAGRRKAKVEYPEYVPNEEVLEGLNNGTLVKGYIRINQKNYKEAYVNNPNVTESDYVVTSLQDRNRALDGDEVVLKLKTEEADGKRTATVVLITKKVHPRIAVGRLEPHPSDKTIAVFLPRDKRFPIVHIQNIYCPNGFRENPSKFEKNLFSVKLLTWTQEFAQGIITENLGLSHDIKVESVAILKEFCLDVTPFPPAMLQYVKMSEDLREEWLEGREDIRRECVFTIDPATARDLDDAVSVKVLPSGNYEVGVHIADVSFFLDEGTPLDEMVSAKATTIYMVESVYHMLPVELCMQNSLLPGRDKLSFSVFWEMTQDAEIVNTRFGRTVMNSCCQLAYEHAQEMIENPDKEFDEDELPPIVNGYTSKDLTRIVNILQSLAVVLRKKRFDNGALRIDQTKLAFSLDPRDGKPSDIRVYELKEANRLIEEFMLLANISVGGRILDAYPELAFLRLHEPPKGRMLIDLQRCLETLGIHFDIAGSKELQESFSKYAGDDRLGQARSAALNHLFAKPMTRARYFCTGCVKEGCNFNHFALSVPVYTHFTSPIRRYADIMVHRLLAASLGYSEKPNWTSEFVAEIAEICNDKKYAAKRAGESSSNLFLAFYIDSHQPFIKEAVVLDVKDRSFDALVMETGTVIRVFCDNMDEVQYSVEIPTSSINPKEEKTKDGDSKVLKRLNVVFKKTNKLPEVNFVIELFTIVTLELYKVPDQIKISANLLRPNI